MRAARLRLGSADVEPGDRAPGPRRAASSVVRMRTVVVLPAPLGPSRPSTVPCRDGEVDAVEREGPTLVDCDQPAYLDGDVRFRLWTCRLPFR